MMVNFHRYFLALIFLFFSIAFANAATTVAVGAIRWDAWDGTGCPSCGNGTANASVRTSLGNSVAKAPTTTGGTQTINWQLRAPWFSTPTSPYTITIDGNQQTTMDAEIAYAKSAGLNYWAFAWYSPTDALQFAWQLYQASAHKSDVDWCLLLNFSHLGGPSGMAAAQAAFVTYFQQANYQTVLSGRPLVYLFMDSTDLTAWGGSYTSVQTAFNNLRTAATNAGVPTPYLVVMYPVPATAASIKTSISADAISNYFSSLATGQPATYAAQIASDAAFWAAMGATGSPIVPIVQTGWDTRPRKMTPPPFAPGVPGSGMLNYVAAGTPAQIASDFQAAISYVLANPSVAPSKAVIAYSWDECDEGGSTLIPTYSAGGPVHAILDAVGTVLNAN